MTQSFVGWNLKRKGLNTRRFRSNGVTSRKLRGKIVGYFSFRLEDS